jgi:hypothetical protein
MAALHELETYLYAWYWLLKVVQFAP